MPIPHPSKHHFILELNEIPIGDCSIGKYEWMSSNEVEIDVMIALEKYRKMGFAS